MAKFFQFQGQKYEIVLSRWDRVDHRIEGHYWRYTYGVNSQGDVVCRESRHITQSGYKGDRKFSVPHWRDLAGNIYPMTREFLEGWIDDEPTREPPPNIADRPLLCDVGRKFWIPNQGKWGNSHPDKFAPEWVPLSGWHMPHRWTPGWDRWQDTAALLREL